MRRRQLYRPFAVAATAILLAGMLPSGVFAGSSSSSLPQANTAGPVTAAPDPADWPQLGNGPTHLGKSAVETTLSPSNVGALGVKWRGVTGGLVVSSPAVVNGVVYVGSFDGKFYAYPVDCAVARGAACTPLWTADLGAPIESSPAVVDGVVYIKVDSTVADSTEGHLYALAADTGAVLWTAVEPIDAQGASLDSPTVADGVVYSPNGDGILRAFDAAGVTNCTPGSPTVCTPLWQTATNGYRFWSAASVANGMVYAVRANGQLFAYPVGCATDGSICPASWVGTTGGGTSESTPAVANGKVYFGTTNGKLNAFDAAGVTNCVAGTCTPLWTTLAGGGIFGTAAVDDGVVYVGSGDSKLYALNADTGAVIWTGTLNFDVDTAPIVANGVVYVGDRAGYLDAFAVGCNSGGGSCSRLLKVGGSGGSSPAIANGVVYAGSDDTLYAFDLNPPHDLVLNPSTATISNSGSRTYAAEGFDAGGHSIGDATSGTTFTITGGGSCSGAVCTSTVAGDHTVTCQSSYCPRSGP
jgi:eukaryotic-like serine/threonine-protein kinase